MSMKKALDKFRVDIYDALKKEIAALQKENAKQAKVIEVARKLIDSRPGDLSWDEAWYSEEVGGKILTILGELEKALREQGGEG